MTPVYDYTGLAYKNKLVNFELSSTALDSHGEFALCDLVLISSAVYAHDIIGGYKKSTAPGPLQRRLNILEFILRTSRPVGLLMTYHDQTTWSSLAV